MKKLMVLATVAAMAMGAYSSYLFDMTISEAPEGWESLGDNAIWGLYDRDGKSLSQGEMRRT